MKYEVGDRVQIKSLDWYNDNKNNKGIIVCGSESFTHPMSYFCNKVVNIITIQDDCYRILEDDGDWYWTDEMIEGLVEEPVLSAPNITDGIFISEKDMKWTTEYLLPDGYIFKDENGNVINATKIVLEKKEKKYPKTYEECCKIIHSDPKFYVDTHLYSGALGALYKLLICRDAYWKLYGDETELRNPWKPDWEDSTTHKFIIYTVKDKIHCGAALVKNHLLAFPTEEMGNAFYENFKSEIESVKELL